MTKLSFKSNLSFSLEVFRAQYFGSFQLCQCSVFEKMIEIYLHLGKWEHLNLLRIWSSRLHLHMVYSNMAPVKFSFVVPRVAGPETLKYQS